MNTSIISRLAPAAGVLVAASLALIGLVSVPASNLSAVLVGTVTVAILGFTFADYNRKPRFGTRTSHSQSLASKQPAAVDSTDAWTYQTISA
jgi:hypothetical protein